MSADRLRQAARVLRERAEAASEGEWRPFRSGLKGVDAAWIVDSGPTFIASTQIDSERGKADATYIATVHPGVGLALADWLDAIGAYWALVEESGEPARDADGWEVSFDETLDSHALRIADLILGGGPDA